MKEKLKDLRLNITVPGILSIIVGVLLLIYPESSLATIGKVIGCIIILAGLFIIISQVYENGFNAMGMVVGGVLAVIGV